MEEVAEAVSNLGLAKRTLERLKTAVAEATMNAIVATTWRWVRGLTRPCNPRWPARNAGPCEDSNAI
jgi:hypothetical protein